jgi:ABC-type amino acid transport substrate-binding protein
MIATLALVAALLVAAGCGDDNGGGGGGSDLNTIKKGQLRVGSDIPYPPFEFGRAPDYQGFDVDVVSEIAKRLDLDAQFVKTPFDTIFRNLAQRKFDMVASATTITPEREKEVDFSESYFPADQSLMVKKGSDIKTVDDVAGKVVGTQLGTTGADYAKKKTKASSVRTYDLIDDAFNALEAGQVEAVINDCPVSKYAERAHENLVVVQAIQTNELYGFPFANGSDALRTAVNKELTKLKEDGGLAKISDKWFGSRPCALHGG